MSNSNACERGKLYFHLLLHSTSLNNLTNYDNRFERHSTCRYVSSLCLCVYTRVRSYHQTCNFVRCHICTYILTCTLRSDIRMFDVDYLEYETYFKVDRLLIICVHAILFLNRETFLFCDFPQYLQKNSGILPQVGFSLLHCMQPSVHC